MAIISGSTLPKGNTKQPLSQGECQFAKITRQVPGQHATVIVPHSRRRCHYSRISCLKFSENGLAMQVHQWIIIINHQAQKISFIFILFFDSAFA